MQGDNEEDWVKITRMANEAGFDLLELNLSCPQLIHLLIKFI